ncbi:MAG: DUF3710 domain-containing protein, partial [Pseudonocardiaceae bacterium]
MFGRRRRAQPESPGEDASGKDAPEASDHGAISGPYDSTDVPEDGRIRLDLGSLRLPVPEGAQLQVEVDKAGPVRAVHLMTGLG